jgi:mannose-6-phosphate isomerase-like protein (cupin superfamily)
MITTSPEELTLIDARSEDDPTLRARFNWLLSAVNGTTSTAAVYGELEAGCRIMTHMDGAEEVLFVLEGTVDLTVGDERRQVKAVGVAVIPALVPHHFRNDGILVRNARKRRSPR